MKKVKDLGLEVKGLDLGIKGLGFGVEGLGLGVEGLGLGVRGLGSVPCPFRSTLRPPSLRCTARYGGKKRLDLIATSCMMNAPPQRNSPYK